VVSFGSAWRVWSAYCNSDSLDALFGSLEGDGEIVQGCYEPRTGGFVGAAGEDLHLGEEFFHGVLDDAGCVGSAGKVAGYVGLEMHFV
jgi:hypothetical protein